MRLSLFRSRSNTPTQSPSSTARKNHKISLMLSPSRTNSEPLHSAASANDSSAESRSPAASNPLPPIATTESLSTSTDYPSSTSNNEDSHGLPSYHQQPPTAPDFGDVDSSTIDEGAMTRRLMDIESSFLPDPINPSGNSQPARSQPSRISSLPNSDRPVQSTDGQAHYSANASDPGLWVDTLQPTTTAPSGDAASLESPYAEEFARDRLSSPAAAAAQRNKLRGLSRFTPDGADLDGAADSNPSTVRPALTTDEAEPQARLIPAHSSADLFRPPFSNTQDTQDIQPTSDPTGGTFFISGRKSLDRMSQLHSRKSRRPHYLSSRQSSQRASKDSFVSQRSEVTIAPGHDGYSGAATPHTLARGSRELSRLPSLGSIASSVSDGPEPLPIRDRDSLMGSSQNLTNQQSLAAATKFMKMESNQNRNPLDQETPRAITKTPGAPSDTVLAKHVREVEVPDTVAREYRAARPHEIPPNESASSSPFFSRGKRELTLKEQNSKLDKLTKENFDLKLKIHFLHQALQERSDEGVSDLMSQNAHLQADKVKLRKENQSLRKQLRQLEGKQKGWENASADRQTSVEGSEDDSSRSYLRNQLEDEVSHLRNQVLALQDENAKLLQGSQPEWETIETEKTLREEAERRVLELQHQIDKLRGNSDRVPRLRIRASNTSLNQGPRSVIRETISEEQDDASLSGNTLVEHLRNENASLKRDLGVQTDMLSSRNRERERLQQEIEDLKLVQRRNERNGTSVAGDSIFDRSVSRSQNRPMSSTGEAPSEGLLNDHDRDHFESMQYNLRDEVAALKLRNQDLQIELNTLGDGAEHIRTLQLERDEAIQALHQADADIDYLYDEMDQLEELVLAKEQDIEALENALRGSEEEAKEFRRELKGITESFDILGEDRDANQATISSLQQDITNANNELEAMENSLQELATAKERLEVQQESAQNEIVFLREEQEADKIKIGDLQSALESAKASLQSEESRFQAFQALEQQASKAREETRELRKAVTDKEADIHSHRTDHEELQATFDQATKHFEDTKAGLLDNIRNLKSVSETKSRELEQSRRDYSAKDRVLQDREALLESSNNETRRLNDLLEKERQGRKHDRNEHERAIRSAKGTPEARVLELQNNNTKNKKALAELQTRYDAHVAARDTLLHSVWTRLSELCTGEKFGDFEPTPQTLGNISKDLANFEEQLSTVIQTIQTHVHDFPARLRETEEAIGKNFETLGDALRERQARISKLEEHMDQLIQSQTERSKESVSATEYTARIKQENKLLRKELRYLKEGSFALPGLHSPFDGQYPQLANAEGDQGKGNTRGDSALAPIVPGTRPRPPLTTSKGNLLVRTQSANDTDLRAQLSPRNVSTELSNNRYEQGDSQVSQRSVSTATALHHQPSTEKSGTGTEPSKDFIPGINPSDQRWILRLEEIKRRLRLEREGRLLDRDGARKRLEQGRRENKALKEELRREKVRSSAASSSNAEAENTLPAI